MTIFQNWMKECIKANKTPVYSVSKEIILLHVHTMGTKNAIMRFIANSFSFEIWFLCVQLLEL